MAFSDDSMKGLPLAHADGSSCLARNRLFARFLFDLQHELALRNAFSTWVWKDNGIESWYKLRRHARQNTEAAWENFADHVKSHRCK